MELIDIQQTSNLCIIGFEEDFDKNFKLNDKDKIVKGNNSTIYKCKNKLDEKYYVVKKYNEVNSFEEFFLNFQEVFSFIRTINNENTINSHQIFVWEKRHISSKNGFILVIVNEFCEGGTLENKINKAREKDNPFSEEIIEKYAINLINSFNSLIENLKLSHRNLKPSNIFFKDKEEKILKISNFNICNLTNSFKNLKVLINSLYLIYKNLIHQILNKFNIF